MKLIQVRIQKNQKKKAQNKGFLFVLFELSENSVDIRLEFDYSIKQHIN